MGSRYVIFILTAHTLFLLFTPNPFRYVFRVLYTGTGSEVRLLTHFLPHSCSPSIAFLQTGFCETFNFLLKLKACIGY